MKFQYVQPQYAEGTALTKYLPLSCGSCVIGKHTLKILVKYLQCIRSGNTAVLHKAINMMHNSLLPQYLHVGATFLLVYIYMLMA